MLNQLLGDRYRITSKIGEGGMAFVYSAVDEKLGRTVAIKVLHSQFSKNKDILRRFQQEAQAISILDHPNILKVFDFSGLESPDCWIVTELIQGQTLADFLDRFPGKRLHPIVAACIICEASKAIRKAHEAGIIHRDIKPENIMLTDDGTLKLMDFGIAKNMRSSHTQTGTFMGSPAYMSPEQIRGKDVEKSTDIYSLSVLFYELITGQLPFDGNTTHDVILKIIEGKFTPPIQINSLVPKNINDLVLQGMSQEIARRPKSVEQFTKILSRFLGEKGFLESNVELSRFFENKRQFEARLKPQKKSIFGKSTIQRPAPTRSNPTRYASSQIKATNFRGNRHTKIQSTPVSAARKTQIRTVRKTNIIQKQGRTFVPTPPPAVQPRQKHRTKNPRISRQSARSYRVTVNNRPKSGIGMFIGPVFIALLGFVMAGSFWKGHQIINAEKSTEKLDHQITEDSSKEKRPANPMTLEPAPDNKPASNRTKTPEKPNPPDDSNNVVQNTDKNKEIKPLQKLDSIRYRQSRLAKTNVERQRKRELRRTVSKNVATSKSTQTTELPEDRRTRQEPRVMASKMRALPDPKVLISSNPAAQIIVNGTPRGTTVDQVTSSQWIQLPPGKHKIELVRKDYKAYSQTIQVKPGDQIRLNNIELIHAPKNYVVTFAVTPLPVNVSISSIEGHGTDAFQVQTKKRSIELPAGKYKVVLEYQGKVKTRQLDLKGANQRLTLAFNF